MIRKIALVAIIILCLIAALLLSAGRPTGPAKYIGYWRAADEMQTGGPLLIGVTDNGGEITVAGLPDVGEVYEVTGDTDTKLTLEQPTTPGSYENIVFDAGPDGAFMKVVFVPVEDPGTAGVPSNSIDFVRATGPEEQLAAELAAGIARRNRPPEVIIEENARIISQAIEKWAAAHNGRYPPVQQVTVGSDISQYMEGGWPTNPVTGAPMQYSSGTGDYNYATDGKTYSLAVSMPDGSTLTLP